MAAPPQTTAERLHEAPILSVAKPVRWLGLAGALAVLRSAREASGGLGDPAGTRGASEATWLRIRNAHLAAVAMLGALRSAECRRLACGDVVDQGLRVVGKGARRREVPCGPQLRAVLDRWIGHKRVRGESVGREDPIFRRLRDRADFPGAFLSCATYESAWLSALRVAGVQTRIGPRPRDVLSAHAARHTGIMIHWIVSGSLEQAALYAGHANLATTYRHYFHHLPDRAAILRFLNAPAWLDP